VLCDCCAAQPPAAKRKSQVGTLEVDEEGRSHFGGGQDDEAGGGDGDSDARGEDDVGDSDGDDEQLGGDFFKQDKDARKATKRAAKLAAVQAAGAKNEFESRLELSLSLSVHPQQWPHRPFCIFFSTKLFSWGAMCLVVSGGAGNDTEEWAAFYGDVAGAADARAGKRKAKYTPEQRLAGAHTSTELAQGQKRAATYQIMKNRGLVAHKAKINRNPRVKKKEQFRKATIARKGQVRDIRDAGEGAHYGGESTGIRSNLTRSRKIEN
jgi:U3 small nucleolar RNA-associated protein 3